MRLSEKAAQVFSEIRRRENRPRASLRVAVLGGNCAGLNYFVGLDEFQAMDDFVIESRGQQILLDATSAPYLWGSILDYVEIENEAGFVIFNPNQGRSRSGCSSDGEGHGCMTVGDGKTCQKSLHGKKCGGASSDCPSELELVQIQM